MSVHDNPVEIVCVGAGPAAAMLLERLLANHAAHHPDLLLNIQMVDPHPPGGGRIWRSEQSPLLKLNSMVCDVAFFPDASCTIAGPVTPGLSLAEWVREVRGGQIAPPEWADGLLMAEIARIGDDDFPTRRLNSAYLSWAWEEVLRRAAPTVRVSWVADVAVAVADGGGAGTDAGTEPAQLVRLASGRELTADVMLYALGHNGSDPAPDSVHLADFARQHGATYVAPAFTAEADVSSVRPGHDVIVRGMGLAAIDLVVLLTEGRGGRYVRDRSGSLSYAPSGLEPVLHLGSRRGVPYRAKISSRMVGDPIELVYLGPNFHANVAARNDLLDFERDVWPLVAAELITGYYRELFTAHPQRVRGDWATFHARLHPILQDGAWQTTAFAKLVRSHVPDASDRFDLASFDRPLEFSEWGSSGTRESAAAGEAVSTVQQRVLAHLAADLQMRTSASHTATHALFLTALQVFAQLNEVPPGRWNTRSRTTALPKRWFSYFSYLASGPPGHRLEELRALAGAGVVHFLGSEVEVTLDDRAGVFVAQGRAVVAGNDPLRVPGDALAELCVAHAQARSRVLIDAWLPEARAATSDNPLLRSLVASGRLRELTVTETLRGCAATTGQIEVGRDGRVAGSSRAFAIGPFVAQLSGGAFTRPGMNSLPFRTHDRCARAVLDAAAAVVAARGALISV